jgi:hypothetical protein
VLVRNEFIGVNFIDTYFRQVACMANMCLVPPSSCQAGNSAIMAARCPRPLLPGAHKQPNHAVTPEPHQPLSMPLC